MNTIHAVRAPDEDAREYAYRVLATSIRELFLLPGERMSEAEMAVHLNISRTPVHDTFAQLSRERMLAVEPQRGTFVQMMDAEHIRQLKWMNQNLTLAVLEKLYTVRLGVQDLEPLEQCVAVEQNTLKSGDIQTLARLETQFHCELYKLAGHLPIYRTLRRWGADLYRLYRLEQEHAFWRNIVAQHVALVQALAMHDHETACYAVNWEYDAIEPLLARAQRRYPHYFAQPALQTV